MRGRPFASLSSSVCIVAVTAVSVPAHAQERRVFDIAPGDLKAGLEKYLRQAGVRLAYRLEDVEGRRNGAVKGTLTTETALNLLLRGTGLEIWRSATGSIVIRVPAIRAQTPAASADIGDIVVTARRTEERAQVVPIGITAFTGRDMTRRQITNQTDLANNTPSMITAGSALRQFGGFAIRGQAGAFGATPSSIAYFAEVPNGLGGIEGRAGTYYDLDNVQILKGPQGTLFGKNATGGNVMFAPRRPTDNLEGYAQLQLGNYADREFQGAINLPLVRDVVLLRVAGSYGARDGYTKDVGATFPGKDYDNLNYASVRGTLVVKPVEGVENTTIVRYFASHDNGPGNVPFALQANPLLDRFFPDRKRYFAEQQASGVRRVALSGDQFARSHYFQLVNTTTAELGDRLILKNILSYAHAYYSFGIDYDSSPNRLNGQYSPGQPLIDERYLTEELQVQGKARNGRLRYVAGLFLDRQSPATPGGGLFEVFPLGTLVPVWQGQSTHSRALFAQATYELGDLSPLLDGLSVTGGYRYTWDYASGWSQIGAGPVIGGASAFRYGSYTTDVDYRINPRTLLYVTLRSGYKSGGSNNFVPRDLPYAFFEPEKIADVEIGFKTDFDLGGMKGRLNLDAYRGSYTDIQRTTAVVINGAGLNVTRNAAQARVQGIELESMLIPFRDLQLSAAYSYIDARYTKVADSDVAAILAGAPFPFAPKHKANISARYTLPVPAKRGTVSLYVAHILQSRQSIAQTNQTVFPYFPGYGIWNASLDWDAVLGTSIDASLFASNLFDKAYVVSQNDSFATFGYATRTYGNPRMIGIRLAHSFGH